MKFGLTYFPTDYSIAPGDIAREAEARGFESIWFAEHSHIPVSPATPGPPEPGAPGLPREYYAAADPFVALSMAAATTQSIGLGTGICLVPQRDVFQTAKRYFDGSRMTLRVVAGAGCWMSPLRDTLGAPHRIRGEVAERSEGVGWLPA